MHLYAVTRGEGKWVRRFIENLQFLFLPYKKKEGTYSLQVTARPIQLWEIAFPEEYRDDVLNILGDDHADKAGKPGKRTILEKVKPLIAKALRLQPIPKKVNPKLEQFKNLKVDRRNVGLHLIGLKKDWYKDGIEQI